MGNTCPDICDRLIEIMCHPCPNWKKCQNRDDEANHDQMLICMGELKIDAYPGPNDFTPQEE